LFLAEAFLLFLVIFAVICVVFVKHLRCYKLLPVRKGKVKIDEFQQSPFNVRAYIAKKGEFVVFAVFCENIPSSSDYFSSL